MVPATQRFKQLLVDELFTDITFIVGAEKQIIKAHKGVLSVSSPVFSSMFAGNFVEAKGDTDVQILDVEPIAFKAVLNYIYTDEVPEINLDNWAQILYATEKYDIPELKEKCKEFARFKVTTKSSCEFYIHCRKYKILSLVPFVEDVLFNFADKSLSQDSFLKIPDNEILNDILSQDELNCDEILVFSAALRWASAQVQDENLDGSQLREILGPALYSIRFPRLTPNILVKKVIPKDILTDEEIMCILKRKESSPFTLRSRIRTCSIYSSLDFAPVRERHVSIKFKVNCPVRIYGFKTLGPIGDEDIFGGKIQLKNDKYGTILGEASFIAESPKTLRFTEPVDIESNIWHTVSLELTQTIMHYETCIGINRRSNVMIDGVKWCFKNEPSTPKYGLLADVAFSQFE